MKKRWWQNHHTTDQMAPHRQSKGSNWMKPILCTDLVVKWLNYELCKINRPWLPSQKQQLFLYFLCCQVVHYSVMSHLGPEELTDSCRLLQWVSACMDVALKSVNSRCAVLSLMLVSRRTDSVLALFVRSCCKLLCSRRAFYRRLLVSAGKRVTSYCQHFLARSCCSEFCGHQVKSSSLKVLRAPQMSRQRGCGLTKRLPFSSPLFWRSCRS